jgi:hypothetical protein
MALCGSPRNVTSCERPLLIRYAYTDILNGSDMKTVSAKSVRKQLETIHNCSYSDQKKQIDALIMEVYQSLQSDEESSEDEPLSRPKSSNKDSSSPNTSKSAEYDAYVVKPSESKRKTSSKEKDKKDKPAKKRKTKNSSETGRGAPNNGFNKPLKINPAIQVLTRTNEEEVSTMLSPTYTCSETYAPAL